jgi:hypothetical protein
MARFPKTDRHNEFAEDVGTARIVARARREIAAGGPLFPKRVADRLAQKKKPIRAPHKRRANGK